MGSYRLFQDEHEVVVKANGPNSTASTVVHEPAHFRALRQRRDDMSVFSGLPTLVTKSDATVALGAGQAMLDLPQDHKVGDVIDMMQHARPSLNAKFSNPAQQSYHGPSLELNLSATLMPIFFRMVEKGLEPEEGVLCVRVGSN